MQGWEIAIRSIRVRGPQARNNSERQEGSKQLIKANKEKYWPSS